MTRNRQCTGGWPGAGCKTGSFAARRAGAWRHALAWRVLAGALLLVVPAGAPAQEAWNGRSGSPSDTNSGLKNWLKRFADDQRQLWTSPARVRPQDATWMLALGGATAGLLVADHTIMQQNNVSPFNMKRSSDFSNIGVGALVGAGAGLYLWGKMTSDEHREETGLLSGESALNALAINTIFQLALGRESPSVNGARGNFFSGGTSFPSNHSAVAWSIASMISHEYPGRMTKFLSYGLAGAISVSRVTANAHFPSDVLVGGALGWMVSRQIYRNRHDPELAGEAWGRPLGKVNGETVAGVRNQGSPYVPLDSWVYPAIERLAALGYVRSEFLGTRPWTRKECARLVQEAAGVFDEKEEDSEHSAAGRIYQTLKREFDRELAASGTEKPGNVELESVYTRMLGISGQPLNDSYHFGQTLINDFGRPYAEGFNPVTGFSGWGNWGRFAVYARGEYQHAPSTPGYSQSVEDLIAQLDDTPVQPAHPTPTINQFTLLDTYALTALGKWNVSFGKQSLWWGPTEGGSLILSDNAQPMYMFRVARDAPFTLPGFLGRLTGPGKLDAFMGKLSGNEYPPRPLLHGERLTFKPTPNLEFSLSRTGEFGGVGRALTLGALFNTYFAVHSSVDYPAWDNPGQRNGGFDIAYRWPELRNWVTVYASLMSRDDITPLFAFFPVRVLMNPGMYVSQIPHLRRMDFRGEAVTTDPRNAGNKAGRFAYFDNFYRDDYTNRNYLIGDWIGRVGTGYQLWSTYWFRPRTSLQVGWRHAQVASTYIPHGGTLNDESMRFNYQLGQAVTFSAFVQYENWLVTALAPRARNDVTTSLQVTFWPRWLGASR